MANHAPDRLVATDVGSVDTLCPSLVVVRDACVPLLGGVLLGLAFYSERLNWLAWIALVPVAWTLYKPRPSLSLYLGTFYGGLAFNLLGIDWLRHSYQGAFGDTWITIGHLLSVLWIATIWLGRRIVRTANVPAVILLPVFWISMESLRWHVAGFALGDGFPLLQLGTTQIAHHRLIQVAALGGIAAVTCLVAASNGAAYDVLSAAFAKTGHSTARFGPVTSLTIAATLVVSAVLYGESQLRKSPSAVGPTIGIVSGWLNTNQTPADLDQLAGSIRQSLRSPAVTSMEYRARPNYPDLLLWKEAAIFDVVFDRAATGSLSETIPARLSPDSNGYHGEASIAATARMQAIARYTGCSLIVGCIRQGYDFGGEFRSNSLLYIDRDDGRPVYYDKIHLAPWDEFRPKIAQALSILPPSDPFRAEAAPLRHGSEQGIFLLRREMSQRQFGVSICYDLFFPDHHRRLVAGRDGDSKASFLVAAANEFVARDSTFPRLSSTMQRFRAIECRRCYARNAEDGISAIFDSRGRPVPTLRVELANGRNVLLGRVFLDQETTIYVLLGDWINAIACVSGLILLGGSLRTHERCRQMRPVCDLTAESWFHNLGRQIMMQAKWIKRWNRKSWHAFRTTTRRKLDSQDTVRPLFQRRR